MRTSRTIMLGIVWMFITTVHASDRKGLVIGITSDVFSVPLSEKSATVSSNGVSVGFFPFSRFGFNLGWENRLMLDSQLSGYERKNGLSAGVMYEFWRQSETHSSAEFELKLVKGMNNFVSEGNLAADAGVRWLLYDSFYLGTGIRYDKWDTNKANVGADVSLNWYWQLGIRIFTGKKKKM